MNSNKPKIYLYGSFRIEGADGEDLTPRSKKARAMLALLACANGRFRDRAFLYRMLWGARDLSKAQGALREEWSKIKKGFGPKFEACLVSEANRVGLQNVTVVRSNRAKQDFLEGLDINEPAFQGWRREQQTGRRTARPLAATPTSAPSPHRELVVRTSGHDDPTSDWTMSRIRDVVTNQLRDYFSASVTTQTSRDIHGNVWWIDLQHARLSSDKIGLRVTLSHPQSGREMWVDARELELRGAPPVEHPEVARLVNELIEAVGDTLLLQHEDAEEDADQLCRRAVHSLFTIKSDRLEEAQALMVRAFALQPRGLYLAWQAQIKTLQRAERFNFDPQDLEQEGEALIERALELEPKNSMVLATAANTFCHLLGNKSRSLNLSQQSVLANRANPMGWWALSSATSYVGDVASAYRSALKARSLAFLSPHRFWWDNQIFGPALLSGRLEEARKYAESSLAGNPHFRSNLRYLIAIYASEGESEKALQMAEELKKLEPDFSIDRLLRDKEYPASLLHRSPGLDLNKLSELA